MSTPPLSNPHLIFVYGTLLRGEPNHHYLVGALFIACAYTHPHYRMTIRGRAPFPAIFYGGTTSIRGEVYEVDADTLALLDRLEGHPHFYRRTPIVLLGGMQAETYVVPSTRSDSNSESVRSGDWRQHLADMKKGRMPKGRS